MLKISTELSVAEMCVKRGRSCVRLRIWGGRHLNYRCAPGQDCPRSVTAKAWDKVCHTSAIPGQQAHKAVPSAVGLYPPLPTSTDLFGLVTWPGKTCGGFHCVTSWLCLPVSKVPGFQTFSVSLSFWGVFFHLLGWRSFGPTVEQMQQLTELEFDASHRLSRYRQIKVQRWDDGLNKGLLFSNVRVYVWLGWPQLTLNITVVKSELKKQKPGW